MRVSMLLSPDGTITSVSANARQFDPALRVGLRLDHLESLRQLPPLVAAAAAGGSASRQLLFGMQPWVATCDLLDVGAFVTLTRGAPSEAMTLSSVELVDVLLSGQPLPRVLLELCRSAEASIPGAVSAVLLLGEDGLLHLGAGASLTPALRELNEKVIPGEGRGVAAECVVTKRPVLVSDLVGDRRFEVFGGLAERSGMRGAWAWPIVTFGSGVVGAFTVYLKRVDLPDERQSAAMGTLVRFAALAIERASQERTTREMLERYHLVAEASTNVVYDWNLRTNQLEWSPRMKQVFGYDESAELTFEWWESCVHSGDRDRVMTSLQEAIARRSKTWTETYRFRRQDDSWATVIDRGHLLFDDAGAPSRLIGEMSDVSGQDLLQAKLALTERLASVGTLAAGVAHEINNPLAWISSNLQFVLEELARPGREANIAGAIEALNDARTGADRVATIVRDLKVFSRAPDEQLRLVDVRRALESSITMARNEIRHRANLERRFGDVPLVRANEGKLSQVFLNLLINAAHALPDGDVSNQAIVVGTRTDENGNVVVEVKDTGRGIAPEVLPKIFDPFFTTKPVGQGTGLGLAICHSIVSALGGSIQVESAPGRGSTFRVTLPPAQSEVRKTPLPNPTFDLPYRGTVVLIDDEPAVLAALQRLLSPFHDVKAFTEPRAALEALPALKPDAIFCDVMMPEMSGTEVYNRLRAAHPTLADRLIFMTGGAFSESARDFLDATARPILDKPFTAECVRKLANEQIALSRAPA